MDSQKLLDLYKEMYYFELQRRNHLISSLALPVGVITILAGGLFYYLQRLPSLSFDPWVVAFFALLAFGGISLAVAIICLALAAQSYEYGYIPTPSEIEGYRRALIQYYEENPGVSPGLDQDFHTFICSRLLEHTERNTRTNDIRSGYLSIGLGGIVAATLFLAVTILPFYKVQFAEKGATSNSAGEGHMSDKDQNPQSPQQATKPPPEKPEPPPGRIQKDYTVPQDKPGGGSQEKK
ncbi:MAG: hypothetical protein L0Z46_01100 [Nitrospiraceae bacterium]|nr:hypothetical protein [Nitrospiraceae bacterium]